MRSVWVASDMQNVEPEGLFYDIFEKRGSFDIWQIHLTIRAVCDGPSPMTNGLMLANLQALVEEISWDSADAVASVQTLPLSLPDDINDIPLVGLLRLENCYNVKSPIRQISIRAWCNFKMVPMAAQCADCFLP